MIEDIYRIGLALKCMNKNTSGAIDEDIMPDKSAKIDQIVAICLSSRGNYQGVTLVEYGSENAESILLKKKSPNGPNYAPTAQITEFEKTLNVKIVSWFKWAKKQGEQFELDTDELQFISNVENTLEENEASIIKEYTAFNLPKKGAYVLTVMVDSKFPVDVPAIFKLYAGSIREKRERAGKGTCSLCNKKGTDIIPKSTVFKFFTVDKPGNVSGGFGESNVWRNYPVCAECETVLGKAKEYIWDNLKFDYVDMQYYLIPSTLSVDPTLEKLITILEELRIKSFSFKEEASKSLKRSEKQIWNVINLENDINSFTLLFVESEMAGNVERIVLELKDIYPSRVKRLYEAKKAVEKSFEERIESFNFKFIRDFLSRSDKKTKDKDLTSLFLDVTRKLFKKEKIEQKILLPHYMREIRQCLGSGDNMRQFSDVALKAWVSIAYLIEAECIKSERGVNMDTRFDALYKKYGAGLDCELKCALFLTGALVRKVMDIQFAKIKSMAFRDRLMGLKMRQEDVLRVINEAQQKMYEYDSYSNESKQIVEQIMQLILKSPSKWPMTVDEINFYISAGMSLYKEIYAAAGVSKSEDSVVQSGL